MKRIFNLIYLISLTQCSLLCPSPYSLNGLSCYWISTTTATWNDASTYCQSINGQLVKIETATENANIDVLIRLTFNDIWIGLSYNTATSNWLWEDGSAQSFSAVDGTLNTANGNCIFMEAAGIAANFWANKVCTTLYRFICEASTSTDAPTTYPTLQPTNTPSRVPTPTALLPTLLPSTIPTFIPSSSPTLEPSVTPTFLPSYSPSIEPSTQPSLIPTISPSNTPTSLPSYIPTSF